MQLYNHLKRKPYTINFEKWLFPFNDHSAFFDDWSQKLYIAYMSSINKPTETDGCFQYPYISNNELFYIHFNLGNILKKCDFGSDSVIDVSLQHFALPPNQPDYIYYPKKFWCPKKHLRSQFPILCCDVPNQYGGNCQAVIDGNHRVSAKKSRHIESIRVLHYKVTEPKDFSNYFEYVVYKFLLERNVQKTKS